MFGKWYLHPYLVVPLISTRVPLISNRVSVHCQATLLDMKQSLGYQDMVQEIIVKMCAGCR